MKEKLRNALGIIIGFAFWIGVFGCVYYFNSSKHDDSRGDSREYAVDDDESNDEDASQCRFDNGTHLATVDYYNPSTGHSATYSLEVEVEDCEVTIIYFPSGGWLDDSHISPAEIDDSGDAELEDEKGRTFSVHIDD